MINSHRNERAASLPARLSRSWLLVSAAASEETIAAVLESEADSVIIGKLAADGDAQQAKADGKEG